MLNLFIIDKVDLRESKRNQPIILAAANEILRIYIETHKSKAWRAKDAQARGARIVTTGIPQTLN